ncbi:hypothetical protein LY78DRAFT_372797 [Colletotrichum sublineola]|nr:hypothetical protein LY78DRAFT_372797 [Colletotrichum sublineola]
MPQYALQLLLTCTRQAQTYVSTYLLDRTSLHKYMREEALFSWLVRSTAASIHLVDSQFLLVRLVGLCVLMSVIDGL